MSVLIKQRAEGVDLLSLSVSYIRNCFWKKLGLEEQVSLNIFFSKSPQSFGKLDKKLTRSGLTAWDISKSFEQLEFTQDWERIHDYIAGNGITFNYAMKEQENNIIYSSHSEPGIWRGNWHKSKPWDGCQVLANFIAVRFHLQLFSLNSRSFESWHVVIMR